MTAQHSWATSSFREVNSTAKPFNGYLRIISGMPCTYGGNKKCPGPEKTELEAKRATVQTLMHFVKYTSSFESCRTTHEIILAGKQAYLKATETGDHGFRLLGFDRFHKRMYYDIMS